MAWSRLMIWLLSRNTVHRCCCLHLRRFSATVRTPFRPALCNQRDPHRHRALDRKTPVNGKRKEPTTVQTNVAADIMGTHQDVQVKIKLEKGRITSHGSSSLRRQSDKTLWQMTLVSAMQMKEHNAGLDCQFCGTRLGLAYIVENHCCGCRRVVKRLSVGICKTMGL